LYWSIRLVANQEHMLVLALGWNPNWRRSQPSFSPYQSSTFSN
jgi:hypothetical protein